MEIKALAKSDVDAQRLAELAAVAAQRNHRLPEGASAETALSRTLADIASDCHDTVIVAEVDDSSSVGASPMFPLWVDFAVLGGWLAVFLILSVRFWRWE